NDETEKLEILSIYRKCRVEELKLPLLQGNLKNEENLGEEVVIDVNEDETGTQ
ncbi:hypothetical protein JOM56_009938, partial [Amanita muscaria]